MLAPFFDQKKSIVANRPWFRASEPCPGTNIVIYKRPIPGFDLNPWSPSASSPHSWCRHSLPICCTSHSYCHRPWYHPLQCKGDVSEHLLEVIKVGRKNPLRHIKGCHFLSEDILSPPFSWLKSWILNRCRWVSSLRLSRSAYCLKYSLKAEGL